MSDRFKPFSRFKFQNKRTSPVDVTLTTREKDQTTGTPGDPVTVPAGGPLDTHPDLPQVVEVTVSVRAGEDTRSVTLPVHDEEREVIVEVDAECEDADGGSMALACSIAYEFDVRVGTDP